MRKHTNIHMVEVVAAGLKSLKDSVVFVGGATTDFYITDPVAPEVRPTEDVDCVIEITSRVQFHKLEKELRTLGFKNEVRAGRSLICRWNYSGITVDIMPTDEKILGFSNQWYADGIANKQKASLPSGECIFIFPGAYFLSSKMEAFKGRGKNDFRFSPDMEDIIAVLDGNKEVKESILGSPPLLKDYILKTLARYMKDEGFKEGVYANLGYPLQKEERANRLFGLLKELVTAA